MRAHRWRRSRRRRAVECAAASPRWRCCGRRRGAAVRRPHAGRPGRDAARQRTPAAAGFVNAVLRRFVRERDALVAAARRTAAGRAATTRCGGSSACSHDWPAQWQALLAAANRAPADDAARRTARRGSGAAYVQRLAAQGRAAALRRRPGAARPGRRAGRSPAR
ncbi:MAG: hypothetical protein MZW92_14285 [Comamonadaceae bacterium]|nr:hypothetical protein [Comamonadaceae bacterium]